MEPQYRCAFVRGTALAIVQVTGHGSPERGAPCGRDATRMWHVSRPRRVLDGDLSARHKIAGSASRQIKVALEAAIGRWIGITFT